MQEVVGQGQKNRSRGDGGRKEKGVRSRAVVFEGGEGGEQSERLRRRLNQVEKEKLELTVSHNKELCRLQAELTRLRSSVERGEAQRVELQYQLTVTQRDADQAVELRRDKHEVTERAAELQLKVQELQKALGITLQAREEDQHSLQQEVEERDKLIESFNTENQRLHLLLQDQEETLEESEKRIVELQKESEKEAELNRRKADKLKYLTEREERSRREKELSDQKVKSLESSIEVERAAHLESKFNSELVQLRLRDAEAALAAERSAQQEAQSSLELLRSQFREVERERSNSREHALERLQQEYQQCKSDLSASLDNERKMTSDLTESLQGEKKQHVNTCTLLEQASQQKANSEKTFENFMTNIRVKLQQHKSTGSATDDGNLAPSSDILQLLDTTLSACRHTLETKEKQIQDLLSASEKLKEDNQTLQQQMSALGIQVEESQQKAMKLEEEVTRIRQESSNWSTQSEGLKTKLEKEREERECEKEKRSEELQKIMDHYQEESKARLCFLYCLYQRLLAGCVLLDQPQSILGDFTWKELCDVINEQVDQLTSDLWAANNKIAHLQSVCKKKSVCVRELQRSQECVLSRLEESMRQREEAWSSKHTRTVTQLQNELQLYRSQCDSLRDHASSLELSLSSVTSDLSKHQDLLSQSRAESASFLSACTLLSGVLKHTYSRLIALRTQKTLMGRRLAEREELEEEVRRLAAALGGDQGDKEEKGKRRAVRRWRRVMCVVLAVRRWCALANKTRVLFRLERGGEGAVFVCGDTRTAAQRGQDKEITEIDQDDKGVCARWLHSKSLSSILLSSMAELQGALSHTGSSPPDVTSAAHSALSHLLDHLLNESDVSSCLSPCSLKREAQKRMPPQSTMKTLVSSLQHHFLLFSQRLHSSEVERRSLRLEVTNLKRGLRPEREGTCKTVPAERFDSVCEELQQALSREQEAQALVQQQTDTLKALQLQVNTHTEQDSTTHALTKISQSLTEARQELIRKERTLKILGKHLSAVHKEKKQLEQQLQCVEEKKENIKSNMDVAETSCKEGTDFPETLSLSLNPILSQTNPAHLQQSPAPTSPLSKASRAKKKEKKNMKKSRGDKR